MISIQKSVSLKELTTFRIGGVADYFISTGSPEDLGEALAWARERQQQVFILGGGSNLLVSDLGFRGTVIQYTDNSMSIDNKMIRVASGCMLSNLINFAAESGFSGLQNLTGIPGTVGGAVRGNAGAFGVEMKDVVSEVIALHQFTGKIRTFTAPMCEFGYRDSFFKTHPEWIVLEAAITLHVGNPRKVLADGAAVLARRNARQIQNIPSAGSTFINPVVNDELRKRFEGEKNVVSHGGRVPAGWLMENAGLRGIRTGDVMSSEMHPNYLINMGEATSADVKELIELIKKNVIEKFGVELKEEIKYLA